MTEGSLKLNETARTSRSYTEMISTLPWHQSVTAFCQLTILSGSYDALRSSVCSMATSGIVPNALIECQDNGRRKRRGTYRLAPLTNVPLTTDTKLMPRFPSALALAVCLLAVL